MYKVYRLELDGKARLKQAEWSKKIAIESARAEKEAAILKAEAEIERARMLGSILEEPGLGRSVVAVAERTRPWSLPARGPVPRRN